MKKKLFSSKAGKFFLAVNCLILAILFWFVVKYIQIGELPIISFIFG